MKKKKTGYQELKTLLIIGGVIVLIVGILIAVSQYKSSQAPVASEAVLREDSHITGPEDAAVTLVEFGDFQCPACASAKPIVEQLQADFPDDLRFSFRNFPLMSIHPNATRASEAAEAAAVQGKFWEMHDILYEQQSAWSGMANPTEQFKAYAEQLELDMDQFNRDLTNSEVTGRVTRDFNDGGALGVNSTPTFYLNGEKVENYSYEILKSQIEAIIAAKSNADESTEASVEAEPAE